MIAATAPESSQQKRNAKRFAGYAASQDAFATGNNNKPLIYRDTRHAWDLNMRLTEEATELDRLLETTKTMSWINWQEKPQHRIASYYNPQVKVKVK